MMLLVVTNISGKIRPYTYKGRVYDAVSRNKYFG
jgi:hypothetical protein